jgi:hypothetical protein
MAETDGGVAFHVARQDGDHLVALDGAGEVLWDRALGAVGPSQASVVHDDLVADERGGLIVQSKLDGTLSRFTSGGAVSWRVGETRSAESVGEGLLFLDAAYEVAARDGGTGDLVADRERSAGEWRTSSYPGGPVLAGGRAFELLPSAERDLLRGIDLATGAEVWRFGPDDGDGYLAPPVLTNRGSLLVVAGHCPPSDPRNPDSLVCDDGQTVVELDAGGALLGELRLPAAPPVASHLVQRGLWYGLRGSSLELRCLPDVDAARSGWAAAYGNHRRSRRALRE